MPLTPGTRLGPYEITAPLGAGGMGEVYRAKDTKLNRDVAIKVLPESFALDADRVARFTRVLGTLLANGIPMIQAMTPKAANSPTGNSSHTHWLGGETIASIWARIKRVWNRWTPPETW